MDLMARVFWWVSAGLLVLSLGWAWFALPAGAVVPQQTDMAGHVTDWGTKREFLGAMSGVSLLMLVLTPLICTWAMKGDAPGLNIPHKDYWLAPERAEATKADVGRGLWTLLGLSNLLLVAAVVGTVLAVSRGRDPFGMWPFALFMAWTTVWLIRLIRRYGRVPD